MCLIELEQYIFLDEWNLESRFMHNRERKKPCKNTKTNIFEPKPNLHTYSKFFFFQSFKVGWKGVENGNGSVFDPHQFAICVVVVAAHDVRILWLNTLSSCPCCQAWTRWRTFVACPALIIHLSLLMLLNYSNFQIRHFDIKVLQIILKMKL